MHALLVRIRESFWFLPAVLGVVAIVAAQLLVTLDREVLDGRVPAVPFLDALSAGGGRSILTTIGTAMLTVAGTSFSITISVLATTSSTYGPRLVRNFTADRANQLVLAAFTSTFLYAMVVLRTVHTDVDDGDPFVPVVAIHVAVLLAVLDVGVLVFFIHHIASSTQITSLQRQVQTDLRAAVDEAYRDGDDDRRTIAPVVVPEDGWSAVRAAADGYVQSVEWRALTAWAGRNDRLVDVVATPGRYVIQGDVVVRVRADGGSRPTVDAATARTLRAAVVLGTARTPVQDVEFALQQLVEIAVRGLASGSNDPYTAVSALDMATPSWCRSGGTGRPSRHCSDRTERRGSCSTGRHRRTSWRASSRPSATTAPGSRSSSVPPTGWPIGSSSRRPSRGADSSRRCVRGPSTPAGTAPPERFHSTSGTMDGWPPPDHPQPHPINSGPVSRSAPPPSSLVGSSGRPP